MCRIYESYRTMPRKLAQFLDVRRMLPKLT